MKCLITIFLLFISFPLYSQLNNWIWQNPLPQGNDVYSIQYISSGIAIAIGMGGIILKTTDDGLTWKVDSYGQPSIQDLAFADSLNGIAVGGHGRILKTTDGGLSWSESVFNPEYWSETVRYLGNNIYINAGSRGTINRSTDGGLSWTQVYNAGSNNVIYTFAFQDSLNGIAFLNVHPTILKTTDGGITWNASGSFLPDLWYDISFYNHDFGIAVGGIQGYSTEAHTARTTDGGLSWTMIPVSLPYGLNHWFYDVLILDENTIIASGHDGLLARSTDAGLSWTYIPTSVKQDLFRPSSYGNTVLVPGRWGKILRSSDRGISWSDITTGNYEYFISVAFADQEKGIALSDTVSLITTNGGNTWTRFFIPHLDNEQLKYVSYLSGELLFVVSDMEIKSSSDDGVTWMHNPGAKGTYISFADKEHAIVSGGWYNSYKTTNAGISWSTIPFGFARVIYKDINTAVGLSGGWVFRTTDGGTTWLPVVNEPNTYFTACAFADAENGFVAGSPDWLERTTDGGATWFQENTPQGGYMYDIVFSDPFNGITAGYAGVMLRTTDGGNNWFTFSSGTSWDINAIAGYGFDQFTAVGQNGTILKKNRNNVTVFEDKGTVVQDFKLMQNYPNPFNPATIIKYSLPSAGQVKISVYDVLGRNIKVLLNENKPAGTYEVSFDGSSLPSGVYFYRIETGTFTETKKMVLVR